MFRPLAEDPRLLAIQAFALAAAIQLAAMLILGVGERVRPATLPQQTDRAQNIGIGSLALAAQILAIMWISPLTILAINHWHGGLLVLPASGYGLIGAIAIYVIAMDLGEYLFHRAQHAHFARTGTQGQHRYQRHCQLRHL